MPFNMTFDVVMKIAAYSAALEELTALAEGIDDDWWFNRDLPDELQDKVGLKLKMILSKYASDTQDIVDELKGELNASFYPEMQ